MIAGPDTATLQRMALTFEIEELLYREGKLLDDRRYAEWLDLLADDIRYWMPLRKDVPRDEMERENTRRGRDIGWFDEGKDTLQRRVNQILTGKHWAEEPPSRLRHLVSNVHLLEVLPSLAEPREVTVACCFVVYRNRLDDETDVFVGQRTDMLRRDGGSWKIASREIVLDQNVLLAKNLTFFF